MRHHQSKISGRGSLQGPPTTPTSTYVFSSTKERQYMDPSCILENRQGLWWVAAPETSPAPPNSPRGTAGPEPTGSVAAPGLRISHPVLSPASADDDGDEEIGATDADRRTDRRGRNRPSWARDCCKHGERPVLRTIVALLQVHHFVPAAFHCRLWKYPAFPGPGVREIPDRSGIALFSLTLHGATFVRVAWVPVAWREISKFSTALFSRLPNLYFSGI